MQDYTDVQTSKFSVKAPSLSLVFFSEVYKEGGDEFLVQQLYQSCPKTVASSAATLINLAEREVIRCSILSHGAIQALVEPLKSTNTQVLVNTARCLAVLAGDEEARAEVGVCVTSETAVDYTLCYYISNAFPK